MLLARNARLDKRRRPVVRREEEKEEEGEMLIMVIVWCVVASKRWKEGTGVVGESEEASSGVGRSKMLRQTSRQCTDAFTPHTTTQQLHASHDASAALALHLRRPPPVLSCRLHPGLPDPLPPCQISSSSLISTSPHHQLRVDSKDDGRAIEPIAHGEWRAGNAASGQHMGGPGQDYH